MPLAYSWGSSLTPCLIHPKPGACDPRKEEERFGGHKFMPWSGRTDRPSVLDGAIGTRLALWEPLLWDQSRDPEGEEKVSGLDIGTLRL